MAKEPNIIQRVAAKAVIANSDGKILILREAKTNPDGTNTGKYHFPGGRLNPGESFWDALRREVREETGLEIEPGRPLSIGEWSPTIRGQIQQIVAFFVACKALSTEVVLSEEHDDYRWIHPTDLTNYEVMAGEPEAVAALQGEQS